MGSALSALRAARGSVIVHCSSDCTTTAFVSRLSVSDLICRYRKTVGGA